MPKIRFTDLAIRSLAEGMYFDERTASFGIRVGKNRKTWLILKEPNRTKIRLGHYPDLSLADARKKALVALGSRLEHSHAPTFPDARHQYLDQGQWRPRSKYEITRTLNRHFHWTKTINKITHRDVAEAIDAIEAKSEAAHALKDIKTFFSWCVPRYLAHSPCTGLKHASRYVPRERLLATDELAAIWRAAEVMQGYGRQVQLLIATGQRCNQIISLRPEWIDHKNRLIKFPASIMKGNRGHTIPLGALAASLLAGDRPTAYQGKKKTELDRLSGVSGWTLHDLRRAFASGLASLGVALPVIERLLAHRSGSFAGIVGVYQHYSYANEMQEAIQRWEKCLVALCGIEPMQP